MADGKKPDAKAAPAKPKPVNIFTELVIVFLIFLILYTFISSVLNRTGTDRLVTRGWGGLNAKSILLSHSRSMSSLDNPIGVRVVNISRGNVFDSPGGKKLGSQKIGAMGKVLQGPVNINGHKYWYVDYEKDPDGWVSEDSIAYLESEPNWAEKTVIWLFSILNILKIISILLSLILFLYVLNLRLKINKLLSNQKMLLYPIKEASVDTVNPKWEKILSHVESVNESDWRIAVIEADILLDELLEKLSLPGDTIGEKLKAVEKSDFRTIDDAWEAHKTRNRISHDGQEFALTQREARRIVGLYEKVFKEFEII